MLNSSIRDMTGYLICQVQKDTPINVEKSPITQINQNLDHPKTSILNPDPLALTLSLVLGEEINTN